LNKYDAVLRGYASTLYERKKENRALQALRLESSRDDDVGVDHQAKRNHLRFVWLARVPLMIFSICCELSLFVPLATDSSA